MEAQKKTSRMIAELYGVISLLSIVSFILAVDYSTRTLHLSFMPFNLNEVTLWLYASLILFAGSVWLNRKNILRKNKSPHLKDKLILLVANSCSGSILDIVFIFIFICYCAWIPDSIMDFSNTGEFWWRPLMFIVAFILSTLVKPTLPIKSEEIPKNDRVILFTGVSNVSYYLKDGRESTNLETVIQPIIDYPNIKLIVVLFSDAILSNINKIGEAFEKLDNKEHLKYYDIFDEYKNALKDIDPNAIKEKNEQVCESVYLAIEKLIKSYINKYGNSSRGDNLEFEFTNAVDYNDFEGSNDELMNCISAILSKRKAGKKLYYDKDLLFNISPGTAIISGVMTLNAIKGKRGLIYAKQESVDKNTCENRIEVKEYDPNVIVLDQQILELMTEKMEQQNNKE